jgi:nucleotide-binding universal stress UspA family protein
LIEKQEKSMKVLLVTDGSKFSKTAIDACQKIITDPEKTSFKIVSAVEFPTMLACDPFIGASADYYDKLEQAGRSQAKEFVEQAAAQLRSLFPAASLNLTTEVIDGSPQRVIVEQAENWSADLIIIGSHGRGFWSRTMIGSVSDSVVHHAPCSVLVVRTAQDSNKLV